MKCIGKIVFRGTCGFHCLLVFLLCMTGCGQEIVYENNYDVFSSTEKYGMTASQSSQVISLFARELCVGGMESAGSMESADSMENSRPDETEDGISEAAGLFNVKDFEIDYAKNIHEKLYPASTTKILTAYVAMKYGSLSDTAVVSEEALQLETGSSICELSKGDQISLEQLLYGLMLCSGNDAANVIAEMISGSTEAFVALMNQEAQVLGATNSHFMNSHGLHNEEHYTTLYDLYLIFNAAIQNELFVKIINTENYTAEFQNSSGEAVSKEWINSNKYVAGEEEAPEGITVIGGKTGTTNAAGYCLVLLSKKQDSTPYVSIVLKSDSKDNLYIGMTDLLEKASK